MSYWPLSPYPTPLPILPPPPFPIWAPPTFRLMIQDVPMIPEFLAPCALCNDLQAKVNDLETALDASNTCLKQTEAEFSAKQKSNGMKIRIMAVHLAKYHVQETVHQKTMESIKSSSKKLNDQLRQEVKNVRTALNKKVQIIKNLGVHNQVLNREVNETNGSIQILEKRLKQKEQEMRQQEMYQRYQCEESLREQKSKVEMLEKKNGELQKSRDDLSSINKILEDRFRSSLIRIQELESVLDQERNQRSLDLTSRKRLPYGSPANTPNKIFKFK